jgi:hypothetical protein
MKIEVSRATLPTSHVRGRVGKRTPIRHRIQRFVDPREDPMDNPAVFAEYAQSESWTAVHLVQWFGFLLLLGGLVASTFPSAKGRGWGA